MNRRVPSLLASAISLLLLALFVGCTQQPAAPTAKPAATTAPAPTAAPAKPTTAPAPAATTAPAVAPAAPAVATAPTAAPAAKVEPKGKITYAHGGDFGTNDPYLQPSESESLYYGAVFESLMQFDFNGKLVPALATEYKWVDDKTIEYKLRKGVKFHNGDPFTAADVKFSYERALSPYAAKTSRSAHMKNVDRVDIVDDFTVRFFLKQKNPVFALQITPIDAPTAFPIVPKAYIEKNGNEYYNNNPVATGPYKVKSRVVGVSMTVEASNGWWGPDPWDIAPSAKEIEFRLLKEQQTRMAALLAGEVDVADAIDFANMDLVQAKAGYRVKVMPSLMVTSININTVMEKIPGTDKPNPFRDQRVRQAMRYAIDTDAIIKSVTKGQATKSEGPWAPPGLGAHPERLTTKYTYDPNKAKELLKQANYPNEMEFAHYISRTIRPGLIEGEQAADGYLRQVGMNVKTMNVDSAVPMRRDQSAWAITFWPTMYPYLDPTRTSGLTTKAGRAPAYSLEGDTKIDELVEATMQVTDPKERDELWFKVYDYMNTGASWIPLFVQPITYGLSPRVDYKLIPHNEPPFPHRIFWMPGYPK